jgi:hypothetical protein
MTLIKFETFEVLGKFEREGKGITRNFTPDKTYFKKALRFNIRIPFPSGLFKFEALTHYSIIPQLHYPNCERSEEVLKTCAA